MKAKLDKKTNKYEFEFEFNGREYTVDGDRLFDALAVSIGGTCYHVGWLAEVLGRNSLTLSPLSMGDVIPGWQIAPAKLLPQF
jgi:hypothetical protein